MVSNLNSVTIEGIVSQAPEFKRLDSRFDICKFPIVVNCDYKKADGSYVNFSSFFTIKAYGEVAKECMKSCFVGNGVKVLGRLKQERWKTETGERRTFVCIIASKIEFKSVLINRRSPEYERLTEREKREYNERVAERMAYEMQQFKFISSLKRETDLVLNSYDKLANKEHDRKEAQNKMQVANKESEESLTQKKEQEKESDKPVAETDIRKEGNNGNNIEVKEEEPDSTSIVEEVINCPEESEESYPEESEEAEDFALVTEEPLATGAVSDTVSSENKTDIDVVEDKEEVAEEALSDRDKEVLEVMKKIPNIRKGVKGLKKRKVEDKKE